MVGGLEPAEPGFEFVDADGFLLECGPLIAQQLDFGFETGQLFG
jgi:hypothetical protein